MFYWLEYPTETTAKAGMTDVYARFCIFDGEAFATNRQALSVKGGQPRSWVSGSLTGDYMSRGYFYHDYALNFVAQWRESSDVRANIVRVQA